MEESEARVEMSAIFDSPADTLVASRILGHPHAYRRWEAEHDRLMRSVSRQTNVDRQVTALRSTALSLVHRKAMFDYLRDREITGRKRHRFFSLFYSSRDYVNAVLAEHLMEDYALEEPLQIYEQWHAEYFRAFCDGALAETEEEKQAVAPMEVLKPLLKHQVAEARQAILQMPLKPAKHWREVQIRKSTGDTQKMRV